MIPLKTLPSSIGSITKILPSTYAMSSINLIAMKESVIESANTISVNESIIVLTCILVVSYLISLLLFRWDNKVKVKLKKA